MFRVVFSSDPPENVIKYNIDFPLKFKDRFIKPRDSLHENLEKIKDSKTTCLMTSYPAFERGINPIPPLSKPLPLSSSLKVQGINEETQLGMKCRNCGNFSFSFQRDIDGELSCTKCLVILFEEKKEQMIIEKVVQVKQEAKENVKKISIFGW